LQNKNRARYNGHKLTEHYVLLRFQGQSAMPSEIAEASIAKPEVRAPHTAVTLKWFHNLGSHLRARRRPIRKRSIRGSM
jgi:hypothetical protein